MKICKRTYYGYGRNDGHMICQTRLMRSFFKKMKKYLEVCTLHSTEWWITKEHISLNNVVIPVTCEGKMKMKQKRNKMSKSEKIQFLHMFTPIYQMDLKK